LKTNIYLILCNTSTHIVEGTIIDAIREAARKCKGKTVEIYRAHIVARLEPADLEEIPEVEHGRAKAAIVFDQMFKGFAEIVDRELRDYEVEFHEIFGSSIEKPIQIAERIFRQPARDDYDILSLLEKLTNSYKLVIFFTGDKKLASQARLIPGVHVEYLPPGEVMGKEHAAKIMVKRVKEIMSSSL
jgi:hypothetical protein